MQSAGACSWLPVQCYSATDHIAWVECGNRETQPGVFHLDILVERAALTLAVSPGQAGPKSTATPNCQAVPFFKKEKTILTF